MITKNSITTRQQLIYVGFGVSIAIFYTGLFMLFTNSTLYEDDDYSIIPEADAQILPFEQQLEQIRNPQECTRKVVQGSSAEIPFTLKIFYDTTRDNRFDFKQQGTSFPVVQRTNQVMTFFSEGADQYEIYLELNYDTSEERQIYIEFLSNNQITQSTQEKFIGTKYCANIFVNTVEPVPIPTKEEIFGESLDYIAQIPAMVTAFNANSQTSATSIAWQWVLLLAVLVLSIWTLISNYTGKRGFDSRMGDLDDAIGQVNTMTLSMDNLVRTVTEPLLEIKRDLKAILNIPQIKENLPQQKKESKFKKIIPFRKKKHPVEVQMEKIKEDENKNTEKDEVLEALQAEPEEIEQEQEPTGGFILSEDEEKTEITLEAGVEKTPKPQTEIKNPMNQRPENFIEILKSIDFEEKHFKKGEAEKFTYNELNQAYSWISDYRKWANANSVDIPDKVKNEQEIAEKVIYYAIFAKLDRKMKNGK